MDMGNRAMRLYRCRNLGSSRPAPDTPIAESRFSQAQTHLAHRMYAVESQMNAYKAWATIEEKPRHERTPGEEHFVMCMVAWEKRYKPFNAHSDYECDAALMLFDCNMIYHDEAAQALMTLEEQRRLREKKFEKSRRLAPPTAAGADASYNALMAKRAQERAERDAAEAAAASRSRKRSKPQTPTRTSTPTAEAAQTYDDVFDTEAVSSPKTKRPKPEARSAPASPEKGTEHIVVDAGL